ncbi:MATE family efflux transporter [Hornefia porci]|uniref:MATE family efflux transporter n=1 Tax=Hornefia porci TaxID=2652292 RepID=UPI000B12C53F
MIGAVLTIAIGAGAGGIASVMQAPAHAFVPTVAYIRICGAGSVAIVLYNYIGAVFRGMGDSATPVITVTIACVFNIGGDLIMVAGFHAGAAGAAGATVAAQIISVAASFVIIRHKKLPVDFDRRMLRWNTALSANITSVGLPVALQDFLVSVSFLIILAIVNSLGLVASAGVGVAEKVCTFIMLVPSCFMQSVAAFVAQNNGAGKEERGFLALRYAIRISVPMAILMFYFTFFHGDVLAGMFSGDGDVISAAADYLKAYAVDCLLTCFLFSFVGYFNGMARTKFVMAQGLIGAFCVRVPVSFLMAQVRPVSLFHIGLATPCSTILQIVLSVAYLYLLRRRELEGTLQA